MTNTTLGIGALVVGAAVGLAVALPCWLEPKAAILLRATNADIKDDATANSQWGQIERDVLNAKPVTNGADSRKLLYRVRKFKDGAPVGGPPDASGDEGNLPEAQMLEDRAEVLVKLKEAQFNGHAFQVGAGGIERSQKIPKGYTDTSHAHGRPNIQESKEMVKQVNAILKK